MRTCLYNFDPLKPHFFIVKLGWTGVYIIFLISAQKHRLWYSLEPPRWGGSNEYLQSMFWAEILKRSEFLSENFQFLVVKFSVYLNRHVFVMGAYACFMHFFFWFLFLKACCGYSFELHQQVDAIQMGTHNMCLYTVDKKYSSSNLKITELLECAHIVVWAVIRVNMVFHNEMKIFTWIPILFGTMNILIFKPLWITILKTLTS